MPGLHPSIYHPSAVTQFDNLIQGLLKSGSLFPIEVMMLNSELAVARKFKEQNVCLIESQRQVAISIEVQIKNFGFCNLGIAKNSHKHADQFFDVSHCVPECDSCA